MGTRRTLELDERLKNVIDEEFADFEKYLPTPQDKKAYERKRKEYWGRVKARLKEAEVDGRTNDNAVAGN